MIADRNYYLSVGLRTIAYASLVTGQLFSDHVRVQRTLLLVELLHMVLRILDLGVIALHRMHSAL